MGILGDLNVLLVLRLLSCPCRFGVSAGIKLVVGRQGNRRGFSATS